MRTVIVRDAMRIPLGKQGENNAVRVVWPEIAEKYAKLYGEGRFELVVVQRGQVYPAVVNVDGADLVWDVRAADTATAEVGSLELIYYVGDTIAKSQTWETVVVASASAAGTTEPPEDPARVWFDEIKRQIGDLGKLTTKAKENLVGAINEAAQTSSGGADWAQNDPTAKDYVKNRTHWVESGTAVYTLTAAKPTTIEGLTLIEGDTLHLKVDGKTLDLVVKGYGPEPGLTTLLYVGDGPDGTNYGWTILKPIGNAPCRGITKDDSHSIEFPTKVYHKLPAEFAPISVNFELNPDIGSISNPSKLVVLLQQFHELGIRGEVDEEDPSTFYITAEPHYFDRSESPPVIGDIFYSIPESINDKYNYTIDTTKATDYDKEHFYPDSSRYRYYMGVYRSDYYGRITFNPCYEHPKGGNLAMTAIFTIPSGRVYTAVLDFKTTSTAQIFDQDWILTITRIM